MLRGAHASSPTARRGSVPYPEPCLASSSSTTTACCRCSSCPDVQPLLCSAIALPQARARRRTRARMQASGSPARARAAPPARPSPRTRLDPSQVATAHYSAPAAALTPSCGSTANIAERVRAAVLVDFRLKPRRAPEPCGDGDVRRAATAEACKACASVGAWTLMFNQRRSLFTNSVKAYVDFFERNAEGIEARTSTPTSVRGARRRTSCARGAREADGRHAHGDPRGRRRRSPAISLRSTAASTGCCLRTSRRGRREPGALASWRATATSSRRRRRSR